MAYISARDVRGYERLVAAAKDMGVTVNSLLAMAPKNDPFYAGSPAQSKLADWFAEQWEAAGYRSMTGVHIRRMHYNVMSRRAQLPAGLVNRYPDGTVTTTYENTLQNWGRLCEAAKYARHLGLVSENAFSDHRNPDPIFHVWQDYYNKEPAWLVDDGDYSMPQIPTDLSVSLDWSIPDPEVTGYAYGHLDQSHYLAVFIEKSTMNDVLVPLCQRIGADLYPGLGFQSITTSIALLKRIRGFDKPSVIFYVSDFDPAGDAMAASVARQLEWWLMKHAPRANIILQPVVLTLDQVQEYDLPPAPAKETDKRVAAFEARYGMEGVVELDALEALHPGALAEIMTRAAAPYRDFDLSDKLEAAKSEAQDMVLDMWNAATRQYQDPDDDDPDATHDLAAELKQLEDRAREIALGYTPRLEELNEALQADLTPIANRVDEIQATLRRIKNTLDVDLPARPAPEPEEEADDRGALYRSDRDYMTQMHFYKSRKAGINADDGNGHAPSPFD